MLSTLLSKLPYWYIVLAALMSFYFGVRGVIGQRIAAHQLNQSLKISGAREWKQWEIIFVRYVQDFVFHVVCSVAGFIALFLAVAALQEAKSFADIQPGSAVLVVFCLLLGLVGVCGQLPHLLLEGRFPKGG